MVLKASLCLDDPSSDCNDNACDLCKCGVTCVLMVDSGGDELLPIGSDRLEEELESAEAVGGCCPSIAAFLSVNQNHRDKLAMSAWQEIFTLAQTHPQARLSWV